MTPPADSFRDMVRHLCKYPGRYVPAPSFICVCTDLCGYDAALDNVPLAGFREWLVLKFDDGDNMVWDGLAHFIIRPDIEYTRVLSWDQEKERIASLGLLLEEFIEHREKVGVDKIRHDHEAWKRARNRDDKPRLRLLTED